MILARLRSLLRNLRHRSEMEKDMADEIRFHVEARARDLQASGWSENLARRHATLEFGSIEKYKEESRKARGLRFFDELHADLRYAMRQLARNKGFAATGILVLAIGIGANTAAFDQLNAALYKTLPVENPRQLRQIRYASANDTFRKSGNAFQISDPTCRTSFSYPAYRYLRDRATLFSDVFSFGGPQSLNVGISGKAESATGLLVSGNYFRGLGVKPALGRSIVPEDDNPGAAASVAVLSYGYWQRAFGGDASAVGRTIIVNGQPVLVVGVTPKQFAGLNGDWHVDVMLPMGLQPFATGQRSILEDTGSWSFLVLGRLKSGVSEELARSEMELLLQQAIRAAAPEKPYDPPKVSLAPMERGFRSFDATSSAILSISVVALVLLISCANLAGLLLARASSRRLENGTRFALGASRGRILRQLLTESMLLSIIGGALGVAIACVLTGMEPGWLVLVFSSLLSIATGIAFGLAPALRATRIDVVTMLKQKPGAFSRHMRLVSGKGLVTVQVALSLILLIGAGLFLRTIFNLNSQPLGFSPDNVIVFRMDPSLNGYRDDRLRNFYEEALQRIGSLPDVDSASISRWGILTQAAGSDGVCLPGREAVEVAVHPIAPRYFETMRIPILAGRDLKWDDRETRPRVALVNEAFAKRFFGGKNPVGETFEFLCSRGRKGFETEIIGLVGNVKYINVRYPAPATVYFPYRQGEERWMTFGVRTKGDSSATLSSVRNVLAGLDPNLPIYDVRTQREWIDGNFAQEHNIAVRLIFFGAVALLLACSGIYGTLAYLVNARTSEIGIRVAIGAARRDIVHMVLRESLIPVLTGIALGLAGALALTRLVATMLFGVKAGDPLTIVAAALFLLIAAGLAAYIPARHASRISPMVALKYE